MKQVKGNRRWIPAVSALLAISLAACGSGENRKESGSNQPPAPNEPEASVPTMPNEPIELTFYTQYSTLVSSLDENGFMNDFGQYMMKKYPNLKFKTIFGSVTKESLANIVAAKTPIDFIQISPVQTYSFVDLGVVSDITDLIQKYRLDLSKVHKSSLDLIAKAGYDKLTGLPYQINSLVMFYNKDIFDKFGVPYPKENMTWAETADLARRVTRLDGGIQYVGLASQQDWHNVMRSNQFSLEPIDPVTHKATFDGWKIIFEEMMPVFQIPGNEVRNSATGITQFVGEKRVAMLIGYPEFYQRFPADLNWDVTTAPMFKDRPGVNFAPVPIVLAPVSYSKKRDAAFLAIAELLSEEVQLVRARKYAITSVLDDAKIRDQIGAEVPALQGKNTKVMQPLNMAPPITFSPYTNDAMNAILRAFNDSMSGKKDINTALREQAEEVDKKIAERKQAEAK